MAGVFHRVKTVAEVPAAVLAIARDRRGSGGMDATMLGLDLRPALAAAGLAVGMVARKNGEAARLRHRAEAARAELGVTGGLRPRRDGDDDPALRRGASRSTSLPR